MSAGWVLVAWTPDPLGEAALRHGLEEARARGRGLAVLNATKGDALVDDRYASDDDVAALERRLREELAGSEVALQVRHGSGEDARGDVATQVLALADELDAALVVVGVRRRTPVGKLLMGSVAQRVILGAPCPVLAVKPA